MKRRAIKLFALAVLGAAWAITSVPATAGAAGCPNEIFRGGFSGLLPECRAYEMVSPPDKWNSDVEPRGNFPVRGISGFDGDYAFASVNGLPGSENGGLGTGNVAKRGADGWTSVSVTPPETNQGGLLTSPPLLLSRDLNQSIVQSRVALTADAQPGNNLYLRTISPPSLRLITPVGSQAPWEPRFMLGASDDFSQVFFKSRASLTPDSPELTGGGYNLYEWNGSTVQNVGILPGQTEPTTQGTENIGDEVRSVSSDGRRVAFVARESSSRRQVFLRDNGTSVEVSAPAPGVVDPNGFHEASLAGAATDLSSVFFTSNGTLTEDAFTGTNPSGQTDLYPNLYRFDVATGELKDLTVDTSDESGADVLGKNVLVAPSGRSAFFVAGGVLAPGGTAGSPNLYRWSAERGIEFIAKLNSSDSFAFLGQEQVTDDEGDAVAFASTAALTGESPGGMKEIYHWSTREGLACVSCAGASSAAGAEMPAPTFRGGAGRHPLSADGSKVFFTTVDRLVPKDTNGKVDAYEWVGGGVRLISTGSGENGAEFLDASPSAKDVYIVTRDRLVGADRDENTDVYDAREGGGFPEPALSVPCEAEACRPPLEAAPPAPQVGSRSFVGPSNPTPTHHKKKHHKKHKHHHKRHHKKRARACKAKTKRCPHRSHRGRTAGKRG